MNKLCIPIIVSALTVLLLGYLNLEVLQKRKEDRPDGCPNYIWIALISFLAGLLICYILNPKKVTFASILPN